jgi:rRNA maturation endonuclease Nob1
VRPLNQIWVCEDCAEWHEGDNPPDICEICGSVLFESAQDVASEGRDIPTRLRPEELSA